MQLLRLLCRHFAGCKGYNFVIDLTLGFCRPRGFGIGFANAHNTQVQCPELLWVCYNLNWCVMIPEIQH